MITEYQIANFKAFGSPRTLAHPADYPHLRAEFIGEEFDFSVAVDA